MNVWLACFFLLFALAELLQWAKQFSLPLPIYILGGACLAIASNHDKLGGLRWLSERKQVLVNSTIPPSISHSAPLDTMVKANHQSCEQSTTQLNRS